MSLQLAPMTRSEVDIVTAQMGSLNNRIFIVGQQRMYYFIRKSCGPLRYVTMDPEGSMDPQLRSPGLTG